MTELALGPELTAEQREYLRSIKATGDAVLVGDEQQHQRQREAIYAGVVIARRTSAWGAESSNLTRPLSI